MKAARLLTMALLLCGAAAVAAQPAVPAPIALLRARLQSIMADHHGHVAYFAEQLGTGKVVSLDENTPVQTASTIKLALLWELTRQVALGTARWDEPITLHPGEPVLGSGVMAFLDTPVTLTLKDVATFMVIVSDNTATNLMIDRFTTARVDADMGALGLDQTWLYKKVGKPAEGPMPADQKRFGLGKTTARQMTALMKHIGLCELDLPGSPQVDPGKARAACAISLKMLQNQFYRETIPRSLEKLDSSEAGSAVANKTGSLDASRSDVAIVAAKSGPIVLAIYTYGNQDQSWSVDNEGEVTIAKIAEAVVKSWAPEGLDSAKMVPGLGLASAAKH